MDILQDEDGRGADEEMSRTARTDTWERKHGWNEVPTAALKLSKYEIMLEIFHIVWTHGDFKGRLVVDLLKFTNSLFDKDVVSESDYLFRKLFSHSVTPQFHFFCDFCGTYFGPLQGSVSCVNCHSIYEVSGMNKGSFFITLSVKEQMEQLFQRRPDLKLVDRQNRDPNVISDIVDGSMYKELSSGKGILSNPKALTVTFNTDGDPVFKSHAGSIWPIQLIINEIVPEVRFDFENVILCGLWFSKKEPNMTYFLRPFIEEMNSLSCNGFKRTMPDGSTVKCPVYTLMCCVDLVAKPKLQNIKQFNGRYGCGYCFHPNTVIEQSSSDEEDFAEGSRGTVPTRKRNRKKRERRYVYGTEYPWRTHSGMKEDMTKADDLYLQGKLKPPDDHVNGLKGISPLIVLNHFDLVYGYVIDYMHNALAGCTQRLTELLCARMSEEQLKALNETLTKLTPPRNVLRRPRSLAERADFKCKEWRAFLLFYVLFLFKDSLPHDLYENLSTFVIAMFILLKKSFTVAELDIAKQCLIMFVASFSDLYGDINMVYNVHLLTHCSDIVERWGPMWSYSAFTFESGNGELLKLVGEHVSVASQICEKYCLIKSASHFLRNRRVSARVLQFCSDVTTYNYVQKFSEFGNIKTFSRSKVTNKSLEEHDALTAAGFSDYSNCTATIAFFNRVFLPNAEGNPFYSKAYTRPSVCDDTCVQLKDGSYCVTEKFVSLPFNDSELFVFVRPIQMCEEESYLASHIKACSRFYLRSPLKLISSSSIKCKALLLKFSDTTYVIDFPNFYEKY